MCEYVSLCIHVYVHVYVRVHVHTYTYQEKSTAAERLREYIIEKSKITLEKSIINYNKCYEEFE